MMKRPIPSEEPCPHSKGQKLVTHGTLFLQRSHKWIEIKRGMLVRDSGGFVAGQVAALVVDGSRQQVTHFLLTRIAAELDYRLVPLDFIRDVPMETVLLSVGDAAIVRLPRWPATAASLPAPEPARWLR